MSLMHFGLGAHGSVLALIAAITIGGFLSEDGATITAAVLASSSLLDSRLAFASAFTGLWVGDFGVYLLARCVGSASARWNWFGRWSNTIQRHAAHSHRQSTRWKLAASRLLPGTRVAAYVSAGLSRMPAATFAAITALSAAGWTVLVFVAISAVPGRSATLRAHLGALTLAGLGSFAILSVWRVWGKRVRTRIAILFKKVVRWEFWPAWIFYSPVVVFCAWLGARYGGLSLPSIANLNQKNGGIAGESKAEILRELMNTTPEFTSDGYAVEPGSAEMRAEQIAAICRLRGISVPFVLKPDTAQRGAGFRKIAHFEDAAEYASAVPVRLLLQRYILGPEEAGIFYYRFPGHAEGHIFGITRKRFPTVTGDGRSTLKELIESDPRAQLIAGTYLKRFAREASRVLVPRERIRLVEAGNHCQGCIFEDGSDLYSEQLRKTIDEISQKIPGFYVGRFDIRYATDEELRCGTGFKIVELNGAASEATNIYDERNSLWQAYVTLYRQWRLVYAIGAANRKRGATPASPLTLWRDWKNFSIQACDFPVAD